MRKVHLYIVVYLCGLIVSSVLADKTPDRVFFQHADKYEVLFKNGTETHYALGHVIFQTETGTIFCDSAEWRVGEEVLLRGSVIIDEDDYHLVADSVVYSLSRRDAEARGDYVELWSKQDSLFAVGTQAYFDRVTKSYYMEERPTLFLRYPDTTNMIEVVANDVHYDAEAEIARASGEVHITAQDVASTSGCAVMHRAGNILDLWDKPVAHRKESTISGELISITLARKGLRQIDVMDSARGDFNEPVDSAGTDFDKSVLKGERIIFDFIEGELYKITCWGEAYSWYYPSSRGKAEWTENTISGDTIVFFVFDERLHEVDVTGGVVGTYLSGKRHITDTLLSEVVDTIDYQGEEVSYTFDDSVIVLTKAASVNSGAVGLKAHRVDFATAENMIRAYSAEYVADSFGVDDSYTSQFQPRNIPVVLKDGEDELLGDYLEYSIDTEKGRILQSKSRYETGYYYGEDVFRANKETYYICDGRYTTCDADEPHFHFHSKNMKFIEDDKLIAQPVVFYLGRIPLMIIPYYVFPLKKGRHSGFLPFTFGNIEQGDRYVKNVGYYWAASEYWDWQTALDYQDRNNTIKLYNRLNYNKRYSFNGYMSVDYARETNYVPASTFNGLGGEGKATRWALRGAHNQTFSPSFRVDASGSYQSDATYYNDFSTDLADRLNRNTRSQINFTKKFGRSVSLSGKVSHDVDLDAETRTDQLPTLNLSLPSWNPFGVAKLNDEGTLESHWYNNIVARYTPSLNNYSYRATVDSIKNPVYSFETLVDTTIDTTFVGGDTIDFIDTTIVSTLDSTLTSQDTLSYRTRKEYTKINHSFQMSAPMRVFEYLIFNPSLSYAETWYKIGETDQSNRAGIDASELYRTYSYSFSTSLNTKLYGTIYPNIFGVTGLRQVITPSVSYSYTPEANRHPGVRAYAGGAGNATTRSAMTVSLSHIYQAKVTRNDIDRSLELVSISHSFSYNFENPGRPFSNLSTSFRSDVLPNVNFYGSLEHSLYKPDTDDLSFFSPYLQRVTFSTSLSLAGNESIFDSNMESIRGADSASQIPGVAGSVNDRKPTSSGTGRGWNLSLNYDFQETGRGSFYYKTAFLKLNLRFWLTPSTAVNYSQYYDFARSKTINSSINITKNLHCWTGTFFWVPTGSTKGYGFRLYVTAIPALKIDNSQNPISSSYFQDLQ